METRVERYRQKRKMRYIRFLKMLIFICLGVILSILMHRVNETIIELNCLDNTQLFTLDITKKSMSFLGKTYNINMILK